MNILQTLYVCFLFLFIAVAIYNVNVLSIENEKLKKQNKEKDINLFSILCNIKALETFDKEAIEGYVNHEIDDLLKEGFKRGCKK